MLLSTDAFCKAWFPLNVLMIATNRSCLLTRTLLRFAGFHRQPSFGLLRGLWYMEACKSRSASGVWSEITTFRNSLLWFLILALLFFSEDGKSFLFLALLVSIDHSHSISRHRPRKPSQKFNMCDFVATSQAFVAKAVIVCVHWCPYILRHWAP